ncbi:OTU domain-containing protein [Pseudomonas citrulli]|uniref:OTU domain-containing protein n=1 Tax=Pseudomonas citrulli TaxID=3064347 RepID=A0ABT9C213_9PSED|nr:OTU domain-containing protein [Pseudomonas sp. K18]MDO7898496.1 hypothetical protein [Pseudomonas sp. K18]
MSILTNDQPGADHPAPLSPQGKEQARLLGLLDGNQAQLARLFAGLPTFDTVIKRLLVAALKARIPERAFRPSVLEAIDPADCYVNHFATDANGRRRLTASQRFTEVMRDCLLADTPAIFTPGQVGFFTRPDSVQEPDSLFVAPVDAKVAAALESALYIANPTTNDRIKRQFREDLALFRTAAYQLDSLETAAPSTTTTALAVLLARRFLYLFNLYKVDRPGADGLIPSERIQQSDEDRLLDIITTHPSMAQRSRLLRAPIPHVYAVMLEGTATPQKWPAAMVIKYTDRLSLFLYSLEHGLQRFRSVQDLIAQVRPVHQGQARTIVDISTELAGPVFEVAAQDLLQGQGTALDAVLDAPENPTLALQTFARHTEDALALPMLSLAGPLAVRQHTLVEQHRPAFYRAATRAQQALYRRLEEQAAQAAYVLGDGIATLSQFTRQQIRLDLQRTFHPAIDPDPDKTQVTLFQGERARPPQSRRTSLTQLMLDHLRPVQYPNAMREVSPVQVLDPQGERVRHPASGFFITLTGAQLARMAIRIDAGGRYETMLRQKLNEPGFKAAWRTAYLAHLTFKGHEASLKNEAVFKATVIDPAFTPPKAQKRVLAWLNAVLQSPDAARRALVDRRKVCVHGLLLGGTVSAGGQGSMGNAVSVDGVLVFTDQEGPEITGTVGVYFPDSPEGDDFHEFADLQVGIGGLLQHEPWRAYLRSRLSTLDAEQIKRALGLRGGRPLVRGALLKGDFLDDLHRAYVEFHSAYADHRSNSTRESGQTLAKWVVTAVEIVMDIAGLLLVPGFQLLGRLVRTGLLVLRTGSVPMNLPTLAFVHKVANYAGRGLPGGVNVPVRGNATFLALPTRQAQAHAVPGLPLEEALYRRFAVTDSTPLRGLTPNPQGFYRPSITDGATGRVTRPVYVRQPNGTVFRVHDHTPLKATEATLVDPVTGLSIRSSGVMRSTVARMANGEWRAVGFGRGGGKRPSPSPEPGPSRPPQPQPSRSVSELVRTPHTWDLDIMDLVPAMMTRLAIWPRNRSLLIMDQRPTRQDWSVRFTPGQTESGYPASHHPRRASTDIVLRRTGESHYALVLGDDQEVTFAADGDCFFNAIARGLNEGQAQPTFTMQGLRNEVADYIDLHPEVSNYLVAQPSALQQALSDHAQTLEELLNEAALFDLTQIIHGAPNPHRLFQPILNYLDLQARNSARQVLDRGRHTVLPAEMLQYIGRLVSPRAPARLQLSSFAYYTQHDDSLRHFFEDTLLGPVPEAELLELLNNEYLVLSQDVMHILLEYGIRARNLTDHHPRNDLAYVRYDQAVHGQLSDEQLEQQLNGAYLVDRDDLKKVGERYELETGGRLDDEELMEQFMYYDRVEDITDLLTVSLQRFPVLARRAEILLQSPVIASNLGGLFPVHVLAAWIRNPALSDARLQVIAEYAGSRYQEVASRGSIDIDWMQPFNDRNLRSLMNNQGALIRFWDFLQGTRYTGRSDLATVAELFRVAGQPPSNTRMTTLFGMPNLAGTVQGIPGLSPEEARYIWEDLVSPHFSDETIRQTLGRPGSLRSRAAFTSALIDSLAAEEARVYQLIQAVYAVDHRQAMGFLHGFDFPLGHAEHTRLNLALYLNRHGLVPQWAWSYARAHVTAESLRPFLATRRAPRSE